jgi:hypothetical protein
MQHVGKIEMNQETYNIYITYTWKIDNPYLLFEFTKSIKMKCSKYFTNVLGLGSQGKD